jgi:hypothetical protein
VGQDSKVISTLSDSKVIDRTFNTFQGVIVVLSLITVEPNTGMAAVNMVTYIKFVEYI